MLKTLEDIILMVRERKTKPQSESYTNKVHETADVLYHLIVYLEANNVKIEDVMKELDKRKK